ncbi:MAG: DUF1999 family protein, partial [Deinococcales bacterium]
LTKSAYDAGVYDLRVELPAGDAAGAEALQAERFGVAPTAVYSRHLGSRAAAVAAAADGAGAEPVEGDDHG